MNRKYRPREGFTLLELIVVITIIGILGTLVVVNVTGAGDQAKKAKTKHDCKMIYRAAQTLEVQIGSVPESIEEMVNPKDDNGMPIPGGLEEFPKDAWGHEYMYEIRDGRPLVACYGRDNSPGGEGIDEDYQYPEESDY